MGLADTFRPRRRRRALRCAGRVDPYFGGVGPAARHLHRLRRVHDRLPAQRQEHAGQELSLPRRAGRRRRARRSPRSRRCAAAPADTRSRPSRPAPAAGVDARAHVASPPTRSCSRRARSARRSCCTRCAPTARCRTSRRASGSCTRTNSEAVLAARSRHRDVDYTRGVAITSSFHPDAHTHVEPVRYGKGSNLLALMGAVLVDGDQRGAAVAGRAARDVATPPRSAVAAQPEALVGAVDRRAGHADPRQLDHDGAQAPLVRTARADQQAGRRRPEPDLDPGRPRGHAAGRGQDRRRGRRQRRRPRRTCRSPATSSAAARSATRRRPVSSTATTACSVTTACTSSTARPCRSTSASTRP